MENLQKLLENYLNLLSANTYVQALLVIIGFWFIALLVNQFFVAWVKKITIRHLNFDNATLQFLHSPFYISVILLGIASSTILLKLPIHLQAIIFSSLSSVAIVVWAKFFLKITHAVLKTVSQNPKQANFIQAHTLPLFENIVFILIVCIAIYYIFINWNIDMTAWLASAGIIGIAVGFAAKDTLANLFSGVFIMADAPYKIGDYVVLDTGERGEVTKIGIRSTRLLTRDDIEITVPNSVMGNTKIINESGGRHEKFRITIQVGVAYGSDIDKVRDILMQVGESNQQVCSVPEPRVRFRKFGASSLDFDLLCWVAQPVLRGLVIDSLNCAVYKAFQQNSIEIPYSKHDIFIKEMPSPPTNNEPAP